MKVKLESSPVMIAKRCQYCSADVVALLARSIKSDGSIGLFWQCQKCEHQLDDEYSKGIWINHDLAREKLAGMNLTIEDIPIVRYSCGERCARCGSRGTQRHHWATQGLFDDPDSWPTDYLCDSCHKQWHKVVNVQLINQINRKAL